MVFSAKSLLFACVYLLVVFLATGKRKLLGRMESCCPLCCRAWHLVLCLGAQLVNLSAMQEIQVRSRVGKISWRRTWQPTPLFLPTEFHGQRSLVGYSPWVCKELDMTEQLTLVPSRCLIADSLNKWIYEKKCVKQEKRKIYQRNQLLEFPKGNYSQTQACHNPVGFNNIIES